MTKNRLFNAALLLFSVTSIHQSNAANINLTIQGQGKVSAQEANLTCEQSCNITNALIKNTMIATANSGWQFNGWTEQQCDAGSQVLISEKYTFLDQAPGGAKTLNSADLNGDNVDDVVNINLFDGQVVSLINNGDGSFTKSIIDDSLYYPTSLALYDWDNDADQDLLVAEYGRSKIKLYSNDGNGQFSFTENIHLENSKPYAIAVADFNADNLPDILISSFNADISGDLWVLVNSITSAKTQWYNNEAGSFTPGKLVSNNAAMTLDVYQKTVDSNVDIIAAEILNDELAYYYSNNRKVIDTGGGSYGAAFGDIDKDGLPEVLAAYYLPSKLNLLYNLGDATFSEPHTLSSPGYGLTATTFGDFNNDGYMDAATGEFNANAFYYFPTTSYKDCIITTDAEIAITATFIEAKAEELPPVESPAQPPQSTESSSGGSTPLSVLAYLALMVAVRRKIKS